MGGEILPLTAIRGVAAWLVVFYHFDDTMPLPQPLGALVKNGALAVDLFFILSGYVLARQYTRLFASGCSSRSYGWFVTARLARIYPVHLVALLLFLSLPLVVAIRGRAPSPNFGTPDFLRSLLLVQDWFVGGALNWNGPAWSISAEFLFYLVFPLAVAALGRAVRSRAGFVAVPVLIYAAIVVKGVFVGGLIGDMGHYGVFRCLTGCLLGMWLCHAAGRMPFGRGISLRLVGLGTGMLVVPALLGAPVWVLAPPAFVLLVWGLLAPGHRVGRALSHPALLWLGRVSFSTYMIHYLIRNWVRLTLVGHAPLWVVLTVYAALVAAASGVLHHWVEVPGRNAGRRLADRLFTVIPAGANTQSIEERSA
jgi:peptidoglycan/LPS O-acetylase OafA/YrhL